MLSLLWSLTVKFGTSFWLYVYDMIVILCLCQTENFDIESLTDSLN